MSDLKDRPVLLTGATGFIGRHLYPALDEAGYDVHCATRNVVRAQNQFPDRNWVQLDVRDGDSVKRAIEGCGSVYYLIHEMTAGKGYHEREHHNAEVVRDQAADAGVDRIVYLGGVAPPRDPAQHLRSRLETGRILREGPTPALELRASMIIGPGSSSWQIVHDLAYWLPFMLLPTWTQSRTQPVYIGDVVTALVEGLRIEIDNGDWYDLPGPETLTVEEILRRTARIINRRPVAVHVPVLSPKLSSYWLRFITRADYYLARELVQGLKDDLLAKNDRYWRRIGHDDFVGFDEAVRLTLEHSV